LLEIFGLDTTRFSMFVNQIEVDQSCIKKLDLNTTKFGDMVAHPYFEYYMVKSIFNYKDAVGSFDSINQLKQINLIYDHIFTKIEPYLTINGK